MENNKKKQKTDVSVVEDESMATEKEMCCILKAMLKEYMVGKVHMGMEGVYVTLLNGQKFRFHVKEVDKENAV